MKEVVLPSGIVTYEYEDIRMCNTHMFNEAARFFAKKGYYTDAPDGTREHKEFWDRQEDLCLNGMTIPGKLIVDERGHTSIQEVHITGEHYAYLNFGQIKLTPDVGEVTEKTAKDITHTQVARKEVRFPDFWDGDYHFFKATERAEKIGKNVVVFKARRKGYSYKNGFKTSYKAIFRRNSTSIIGAYDEKYIVSGDATMVMAKNYLDFMFEHTDWYRGFLNDSKLQIKLGYRERGKKIDKGYKSNIIGVSFAKNPSAAIGKDAELIIVEEGGKFPNLREMFDVTQPTLEDGDIVIGIMIVFGTGGTKDSDWAALEDMFYNPLKYNMLPFRNVWDDGADNTACGFFHSHAQNLLPYVDKDGNSNKKLATELTLERRKQKEKDVRSATELNGYIGQRCLTPAEGFSRTSDNMFSSVELDAHVALVSKDPVYKNIARQGILEFKDKGGLKFVYNDELEKSKQHPPIWDYPIKAGQDASGCFVEWYPPFKDTSGMIPSGLYRVWVDPFGVDKDKKEIKAKDSLCAVYVYERMNNLTNTKGDVLVASFVGRHSTLDESNEFVLMITLYYNAICQFEADRGDLKGHFRRRGFYNRLADEPTMFHRKNTQQKTPNKGIKMGDDAERKGTAAILLKDWLYKIRNTEESGKPIFNFQYIYDLGLLLELQKFNLLGNFDRISALFVGMYDKQEVFNKEIKAAQTQKGTSFFERKLFSN